jgi:drug/metabolite transporter (DMT)-like permease
MIYLLLSIVSSVLIAVVIRVNEGQGLNRFAVMLFNYLAASAFASVAVDPTALIDHAWSLAPIAAASALFFVTAFVVYMAAVSRLGLAVSVTVTRLSVVIPVLGSVLFFTERLNPAQGSGFALALIAIVLFSETGKSRIREAGKSNGVLLAPLLFLLMGAGDFSLKVFREFFSSDLTMSYIFLVFGISTLYTFLIVVVRRVPVDRRTAVGGFLLGIPNFAAAYFILRVLEIFPGAIAFPVNNIGIILLSTATGYLFWRETLRRRTAAAVLLGIGAVILLNLRDI